WGYNWVGNPDYGFSDKQPGGPFFNLLPYLEQTALYNYTDQDGAMRMIQTPIGTFYCPSRRTAMAYPNTSPSQSWGSPFYGGSSKTGRVKQVSAVGRCDYAGNAGNGNSLSGSGPSQYDNTWKYTGYGSTPASGVIYIQSTTQISEISDGTTNTILFVEKFMRPQNYATGKDSGDNQSAYTGGDVDILRYVGTVANVAGFTPETFPSSQVLPPGQDYDSGHAQDHWRVGSAHPGSMNVTLCDGSVIGMSYSIDLFVFAAMGNRMDGQVFQQNF
ncbi:MAG: DUF1559 domain-containing protein, partial [Planctomycetia bacterium]|nr:DUF1559 domain-containing protein [Planctomycetia bacterium]